MSTISSTSPQRESLKSRLLAGVLAGLIVLVAALFGILTRPVGYLAAFWPANAVILAIMVRWPKFCTASGWIATFIALISADLFTGGEPATTFRLTIANIVGAIAGTILFSRLSEEDRRLLSPTSMLHLLWISTLVSFTSALLGVGTEIVSREDGWVKGFCFWFVGEFVNHLLLLSLILTTPSREKMRVEFASIYDSHRKSLHSFVPMASLVASTFLATRVGGPGAIAFVVPGLMWCSLTYPRFTTALITLLTLASILIADSMGLIRLSPRGELVVAHTMSLRIGVALLALVPVVTSSILESRQLLIAQLSHSLQFDFLTEALARKYFLQQASELAHSQSRQEPPTSAYCLMLDIDHFKLINDTFGHAAGDQVLKVFSKTVRGLLRKDDLFGRLGGEEFSVILTNTDEATAYAIAERIRRQIEETNVLLTDGREVLMTVSIGVTSFETRDASDLESIFIMADRALYNAKENGRNQVQVDRAHKFARSLETI